MATYWNRICVEWAKFVSASKPLPMTLNCGMSLLQCMLKYCGSVGVINLPTLIMWHWAVFRCSCLAAYCNIKLYSIPKNNFLLIPWNSILLPELWSHSFVYLCSAGLNTFVSNVVMGLACCCNFNVLNVILTLAAMFLNFKQLEVSEKIVL